MIHTGTRIEMTKGYKNTRGVIKSKTNSKYEFYVIHLDNGIHIIAGPSAFVPIPSEKDETDYFINTPISAN
ncbi:MAG: hypothetical protein JW882_08780 [Deltaproteobacteria bacterium]|nr:hypothetical protein [Deltaproteobacteria bacterium]